MNHNPFLRMAELPKLLQRLRKYRGRLQTQLGLRLLLFTGVRTGELRWRRRISSTSIGAFGSSRPRS